MANEIRITVVGEIVGPLSLGPHLLVLKEQCSALTLTAVDANVIHYCCPGKIITYWNIATTADIELRLVLVCCATRRTRCTKAAMKIGKSIFFKKNLQT
jgi:hypothetical protein